MTFLLYLCKVFVCSGILLGYYWLFLRNRRFHHYNRFYLQATLLLSVILPFLKIPVLYQPENQMNQVVYQTVDVLTVNYGEQDTMVGAAKRLNNLFTIENIMYLLYGAGIIILLVMLAKSLLYIRKISRRYPYERISELKFYTTAEPGTPFSFFRSIFWDANLPFNSKEGQQVFQHELFHVKQKHSFDIILAEVITALFWWNPFFHLLKKELKAIHEFLADQYAISGNDRYAYAELLVMQTMKLRTVSVTNYFFQNHIKRRIAMITNLSSSRYSYISRLMILPVCLVLFCSIVLYAQQPATSAPAVSGSHSSKPFTVVIDAGHGGIDHGALSVDGKVQEKDLVLAICLKIQQLAPQYNVNVVMTRTTDQLPGNATDIHDGLKIRTAMTEQAKADAFVAIHVSSTNSTDAGLNERSSGFEAWVTKNNEPMVQASKQLGSALVHSIGSMYQTDPNLRQRSNQNLWVLEHNSCPAVLLECGYISNDKDLAYISNADNQEAVAKKILEGIVNYKNQLAATVTILHKSEPMQTAAIINRHTQSIAQYASAPVQGSTMVIMEDSVLQKLTRYFNRSINYPKNASANNIEGTVYYSLSINENGHVSNFRSYSKQPDFAGKIYQQTIVAYESSSKAGINTLSDEEKTKLFQDEVKRVFEKNVDISGVLREPGTYYFKAVFRMEPKTPATSLSR